MRILFLILLFTYSHHASAQSKRAAHWYFGFRAGLDFTNGSPVVDTNGMLESIEGCTSMSDTIGNLLFYSNGEKVWDRTHNVMPNGNGLKGTMSSVQCIAVPAPGSNTKYYVFTRDVYGALFYSVIDMSLGAYGDVVPAEKNILLHDPGGEAMAATLHCDGYRYWILTLLTNQSKVTVHAYLLDSSGISGKVTSVFSQLNFLYYPTTISWPSNFTFCSRGDKVVLTSVDAPNVYLFDFDRKSGKLNLRDSIMLPGQIYASAFSPNDSLLYVSSWIPLDFCRISQFDLNASNISASAIVLDSVSFATGSPTGYGFTGRLQLGPDLKIYSLRWKQTPPNPNPLTYWTLDSLDVINNPNVKGLGCGYQRNAIYLQGRPTEIGLPTFPQNFITSIPPLAGCASMNITQLSSLVVCQGDSLKVHYTVPDTLNTGNNLTIQLSDSLGDFTNYKTIGNLNFNKSGQVSCFIDPSVAPGKDYLLRLIASAPADTSLPFYKLIVKPGPQIQAGYISPVCSPDTLYLTCIANNTQNINFSWTGPNSYYSNNQNPKKANTIGTDAGLYTVTADLDGCMMTDSVWVAVKERPQFTLSHSAPVCEGDTLRLICNRLDTITTDYYWSGPASFKSNQDNPFIPNIAPVNSGMYVLNADNSGCKTVDSLIVDVIAEPAKPEIISQAEICEGIAATFRVANPNPHINYSWSGPAGFLKTDSVATIPATVLSDSGHYVLTATHPVCPDFTYWDSVYLTVNPMPEMTTANNSPLYEHDTLRLYSGRYNDDYTYTWSGPGNFVSNEINPVINNATTTAAGRYKLSVTTKECTFESYTDVIIYTYTPCPPDLLPNPNNGVFIIEGCAADSACAFRITNALGQTVLRGDFPTAKGRFHYKFNLAGLAAGVYHVSMIIDRRVVSKPFVIWE